MHSFALDFFSGAAALLLIASLVAWRLLGVDPLLQLARLLIFSRSGFIIAGRYALMFGREWYRESMRHYRHMQRAEGV